MSKSEIFYPGDDLVPDPGIQLMHKIEVESEPSNIWPWIVQVGYHRAGWYIDKWTDRFEQQYFWPMLVPPEARGTWKPPANEILPEYQNLKVGDQIPDGPPGSAYYDVVELVPDKHMVLRATTHFKYMAPPFLHGTRFEPSGVWAWAFILEPITSSRTRLISRWSATGRPKAYFEFFKPFIWLVDHYQQRQVLQGIKRRVQRQR